MATPTSKRILVSESKKAVATLDVGEWKLTFNYEGAEGKPVSQVTITGTKGNAYFNYNRNEGQTNVSFNNAEYDADLLAAVKVEVDDITKAI
jgi:hypothetical protein